MEPLTGRSLRDPSTRNIHLEGGESAHLNNLHIQVNRTPESNNKGNINNDNSNHESPT